MEEGGGEGDLWATDNTIDCQCLVYFLRNKCLSQICYVYFQAHNIKDMPAAVLNMTRKVAEPLGEVKNKATAYLFVPPQVMTEYILSSRPVQWIIPKIVAVEDMSKLDITMEEIQDEETTEEEKENEKES